MLMEAPCLSEERRRFYETMLEYRYIMILSRAYERVISHTYDEVARERIGLETFKTEEEYMEEYERAKQEMLFNDFHTEKDNQSTHETEIAIR